MLKKISYGVSIALVSGLLLAQAPFAQAGPSTKFYGCSKTSTGEISKVSTKSQSCAKGSTQVSWSVSGVQGLAGPQGPAGPAGIAGPVGAVGATGPVGPAGYYKAYDANGLNLGNVLSVTSNSGNGSGNVTIDHKGSALSYDPSTGSIQAGFWYFFATSNCKGAKYIQSGSLAPQTPSKLFPIVAPLQSIDGGWSGSATNNPVELMSLVGNSNDFITSQVMYNLNQDGYCTIWDDGYPYDWYEVSSFEIVQNRAVGPISVRP
jgi:hypothetical protein